MAYTTAYTQPPTAQSSYDKFVQNYAARSGKNTSGELYRGLGKSGALMQGTFGIPAEGVGLNNLYQMLLNQGRVDPRLLARAQAANARRTQSGQDAQRAAAARGGFGGGGLAAAINASLGQAGRAQAANLDYQDIADSYARNQQNLGLLDQLVIQPQLQYANLGLGDAAQQNQLKAAKLGAYGSLLGGASQIVRGGYGG